MRNVCQGSKKAMRQEEGQHNRTQYAHPARPTYSTLTLPVSLLRSTRPPTSERGRVTQVENMRTDGGASTCMHNRGARFRSSAK